MNWIACIDPWTKVLPGADLCRFIFHKQKVSGRIVERNLCNAPHPSNYNYNEYDTNHVQAGSSKIPVFSYSLCTTNK